MPRSKGKETSKQFWAAFKSFFQAKNAFFRKLDTERKANLKQKQELVQRAKELRDSRDWDNTAAELRKLQQQWKEIGAVPDKYREKIYAEFKAHCDYFFEQLRQNRNAAETRLSENAKAKEEIIGAMEQAAQTGTVTSERLQEFKQQFATVGEVPRSQAASIKTAFNKAFEKLVRALPELSDDEKQRLLLENELGELKADPQAEKKLYQKEQSLRKKIAKIENDITLWKNNLEFFARSKNADALRDEFIRNADEAGERLEQLKQQLKVLRNFG